VKVREAITLFEQDGWYLAFTRSSHPLQTRHPSPGIRALTFQETP
jgi:predicted RNA binding protein YcfA (HicA-like mRNA interferase family)